LEVEEAEEGNPSRNRMLACWNLSLIPSSQVSYKSHCTTLTP
jgi:hypothetical protein